MKIARARVPACLFFCQSERAGVSHEAGEVLSVYCTAHSLKLTTFHALCDTVDETAFGFLVPAEGYSADQEKEG
jgi:hypothetical protein